MTVAITSNKVSYAGNSSVTGFDYPFRIFADSDLAVVLRDADGTETTKALTTDYTVSGAGDASGGRVTTLFTPASGETLVIARELDMTQATDYQAGDAFPAETHEAALDRLTMISQQLQELLSRAVKGKTSTDWSSIDLTLPDPEAGKGVGWNAAADGLANISSLTGHTVSSFMDGLLASDGAAALRAAMGAGGVGDVLFTSATESNARGTLGAGAIGDAVFTSETAANARALLGAAPVLGYHRGIAPVWKDADEISFSGGVVEVGGGLYTMFTGDFDVDAAFGGALTASTWHYIYIDPSTISAGVIAGSDLEVSTTAPTWDADKRGWYDAGGTKRCPIEAGWMLYIDSSSNIAAFAVTGGVWTFKQSPFRFLQTGGGATTWTSVGSGAPGLGIEMYCEVSVYILDPGSDRIYVMFAHGDYTESSSYWLFTENFADGATQVRIGGGRWVATNTSGNFNYQVNAATVDVFAYLTALQLPKGAR